MTHAAAERVRTILARAATAQLTWLEPANGQPRSTIGPVDLVLGADDGRAGEAIDVEVADAAPLPVPDRVRARVRIIGHAVTPVEAGTLRVRPRSVRLLDASGEVPVSPGDLAAATADPLAAESAAILSHLDASHPRFVDSLTGLLRGEMLHGVVRVWPLDLDQSGITLRLVYARHHRDVRLGFPVRASCAKEALLRLHELAALGASRHRCR